MDYKDEDFEEENQENRTYELYASSFLKKLHTNKIINYEPDGRHMTIVSNMLQDSHKIIIDNIKKKLQNNDVIDKAQNSNTYFDNLVNNIINKYIYEEILYKPSVIKTLQNKIIQNNVIDHLDYFIEEFKIKLQIILYDNELPLYNEIFLFKEFYGEKKDVLPLMEKRAERINFLRLKIIDMIKQGVKLNLLGTQIKEINTINYLIILLKNMENMFKNKVKKYNITLTDENKKIIVKQFFQMLFNKDPNFIKNISNNLITIGLPTAVQENIERWISNNLDRTFFQII